MARLRPLPRKQVVRILEANGFAEVRSRKHSTFKRTAADGTVLTTWVPHHQEITLFVIQYIIDQTGKPRAEFE